MNTPERYQQLTEQLLAVVQDYIGGGGEVALLRAYEVGRSAVADHLNALEMVALQQEVLIRILVQRIGDEEGAHLTQVAANVFAESLASFELTTRSSQEGNALLQHLNVELERHVAERAAKLADSEERFRSFMDHSPMMAYLKDEAGRYVYANEQATRLFARLVHEWRGKTDEEIWPGEDARRLRANDMTVLMSGKAIEQEETTEQDDGVRHWLTIKFPLTTATGKRFVGGVSVDITERVRLRELLLERERLAAIGMTAAKLVHEIGNPLNSMAVATQLLERRLKKATVDDTLHASVGALTNEIRRLSQLLQEFRSLSRRQQFIFRPTNLRDLVRETLTTELPLYTAHGIAVEQRLASDLPLLQVDQDKFKQVILNLCKNAVEAMPQGGALTVQVHNAGAHVHVEITDTGQGISDGVDVFEPFVTTKAEGTGLGLPIVRQIVAAHGGMLTYRSAQGQGTTFTVALPLHF